jgi:glutamate dehydrogenase/leucine dehydrogenase
VPCDILSPCALGAVLNVETIPRLQCEAVVGSANNQLATDEDGHRLAERGILYAPDFVVNAGGLINVYDELHGYSKTRVLHRVDGLYDATLQIFMTAVEENVTPQEAAVHVAEKRIELIGDINRIHRGRPRGA